MQGVTTVAKFVIEKDSGGEYMSESKSAKARLLEKLREKGPSSTFAPMDEWTEIDGEMVPSEDVETVEDTDMLGRRVLKKRKKMEFGAAPPAQVTGVN